LRADEGEKLHVFFLERIFQHSAAQGHALRAGKPGRQNGGGNHFVIDIIRHRPLHSFPCLPFFFPCASVFQST